MVNDANTMAFNICDLSGVKAPGLFQYVKPYFWPPMTPPEIKTPTIIYTITARILIYEFGKE
jgi:hypothetical protein